MLSAVENFGPLIGPAVARTHHHPHATVAAAQHLQAHHQQHAVEQRGYALDIVAAAAVAAASTDAGVRVSCAFTPPASCSSAAANISTTQTSLAHTQLTQLNALQALKLQQQFQQQYEQHLSHFLNASSAQSSTTAALPPHRPQAQLATTRDDVDIALAHRQQQQQQQQQQNHHKEQYHLEQQQQQREQHSVSVNLTRTLNAPQKYMSSLRSANTTAMMPLAEFAPPAKPLKSIQHTTHAAHENAQSGAMNLVTNTASNAFASSTNYQLSAELSNTNNCSNPASIDNSRPSSSSSSVDVENDECMSPVSSSNSSQASARKLFDTTALLTGGKQQPAYSEASASSAAAAVVAAYQYNYTQLYGGGSVRPGAGLYNAPVIFAAHNPHVSHVVPHPSAMHGGNAPLSTTYLSPMGAHSPAVSPGESSVYSAEYLKALQNAVFQTAPPPLTTPVFHTSPLGNASSISSKSRLRSPSAAATNSATAQAQVASLQNSGDQSSPTTTTTTKLSTGTYLYEKARRPPPATPADSEKFFKIPSGKEGSLKHRILTRPTNTDKTVAAAATTPVMRAYNSTSSFKKGSYIELTNGSLRRVEDMRTEDFIQCAERSPQHQLIESTVVKINTNTSLNTVTIAFSYDRNQSKVDMEVSTDHPFFVYGQGWASCNPELSFKAFGLRCQRLQVGDICISLTKREPPNIHNSNNKNNKQNNNNNNSNNKHSYLHDNASTATARTITTTTNETQGLERDLQPLILSDNIYAAAAAAAHFKPASGVCPPSAQYPILRSPHGTIHFMPSHLSVSAAAAHPTYALTDSYARFAYPAPQMQPAQPATQTQQQLNVQRDCTSTAAQSTKSPSSTNARPEHDGRQDFETSSMSESARKRRWSAPESFSDSDDDGEEESGYQPPLRQKSAPNAALCSNYKPYLPTSTMIISNAEAATAVARNELNCDFLTNYK
ncbi:ataxin-1 [Eurosta solidaginis]|uniref:ataxin-1 n=1 Tax=Eurosta solidaginis TaxID=178769 RepID=UPI003530F37B